MKCIILMAALPTAMKEERTDCIQSKCAWWHLGKKIVDGELRDDGQCSILVIARRLR